MRTHQRLDLDEPLEFESLILDPAGEHLGRTAVCKNLSLTGLYFETVPSLEIQAQFKVGNIIWTRFKIPGSEEQLKIQCEIRRVLNVSRKIVGFGAMFINLSPKAERLIVNFVK